MMTLTILGSSSSGNCYILQNKDEALVLEAGVKLDKIKQAVDFNRHKVQGVLITHEHADHAKYMKDLSDWGVGIAAVPSVFGENRPYNCIPLGELGNIRMGNFSIDYFPVKHNADCRGFLVKHPALGRLLFITDAQKIPYTFKSLTHVMIEANYDRELWDAYPERRHGNTNHREISDTLDGLACQELDKVKGIVLLHLSDGLSNADDFKKRVQEATGIPTLVADHDMIIDL